MFEDVLAATGRRDWRIADDPVIAGGYAMYDAQDCVRALVSRDDDGSWLVQVFFLERVRTYYDFATPPAALERALDLLRWDAA